MLDTKKFSQLLDEGQRRRAELDKGIAHLKAEYDKATADMAALQEEHTALTRRLAASDKGEHVLSESELAAATNRLRHLTGAIERARSPWSVADTAYRAAENEARGVISGLRSEALNAWKKETYTANEEYIKAWIAL